MVIREWQTDEPLSAYREYLVKQIPYGTPLRATLLTLAEKLLGWEPAYQAELARRAADGQ